MECSLFQTSFKNWVAISILTLQISFAVFFLLNLRFSLFSRNIHYLIFFVQVLVHCRNTFYLQSGHFSNVIKTSSYTVVISITNVNFHILCCLVKQRRNTLRLIKSRHSSDTIYQRIPICMRTTKPRENFISEWVYYFYFMVIGICYKNDIFFGYEMYT